RPNRARWFDEKGFGLSSGLLGHTRQAKAYRTFWPNAVGTTSHFESASRRNLSALIVNRESLIVNRQQRFTIRSTIHDLRFTSLANAGWEYMVKAAAKPARARYKGGTLTDFVAIISRCDSSISESLR